jgi:hypothetical protein
MKHSKFVFYAVLASLFAPLAASAQDAFSALQFLVGKWEAEPQGGVTARTEFAQEIQGKAIVRRNHAEYPPAAGKPAYTHDDLLVIYREVKPVATKAAYFDSAGYYARYTVTSPAPGQATFVSDPIPGFPRYRVSYALLPDGRLSTTIEVSPAGKASAWGPFLQWTSKKVEGEAKP